MKLSLTALLWLVLALFVAGALYLCWHPGMFTPAGPLYFGKLATWAAFAGFVGYSAYCSAHENLFSSVRKIAALHWGRQIGIDLYLGLSLTMFIVYLNERSLAVTLLWLLPTIPFANQITLLYVAIHYDAIVAKFIT